MHLPAAERIRARGLRATRPRVAVLDVLDAATDDRHLAVADVCARVRADLGAVSTQAVYDCLEALTSAGLARRIEPAGHPARYESRVGDNHHHLVCRGCGRTVDVDCAIGAAPCLEPSSSQGFVVDEAEVTFWGRCPSCTTRAEVDDPAPAARPITPHPGEDPR
ncbi:Fur family ferric uptake transcriptional regulator [Kineococcus xinjiangensis]|uniref:Fur family ferric uptake transcriptional regulator n=1 Tax=Kineococcus xinjiangensis TaxID=512762 RepID=A0A2S6ID25_9ACTN|nr:Fur family transcriptional regulator [Kineococcus xinjiangensis]PPK92073.1 Fur family ferric uptake transcriptional regulator [Kineococcus xinjiangensis]